MQNSVCRLVSSAQPSLPVPHIAGGKKLLLSEQEQYFIAIVRALLDGMVTPTMEPVFARLEGPLQELARELCAAYYAYGLEGFWKSYATFDTDIPRIQDLRVLLESGPDARQGILLSEGEDQAPDWLWEPRLALGRITLLSGGAGVGKTAIAIDLAARVTTGRALPDDAPGLQGGVVLITPDDGLWDTLRPRFARAGADLQRVVSVSRVPTVDPTTGYAYERSFSLPADIALLDRAMQRVEARLVIIDPPLLDAAAREQRALLAPLQALLHKYQAACIMIQHLNRPGLENAGVAQLMGIAHSTLSIHPDPTQPGGQLLTHLKTTGEYAPALPFRVVNDRATTGNRYPHVLWGDLAREQRAPWPLARPLSPARQDILALLTMHYPQALSTPVIASALPHLAIGNIRTMLFKMVNAGQIIKTARGLFIARA